MSSFLQWAILTPAAASGEAFEPGEGPVLLLADRVDVDEPRQIVTASGNVEITRGNRRLLADQGALSIRPRTGSKRSAMSPCLEPDGQAIYAELLSVSGDLKDGIIEGLRARLDQDSRLAATSARRVDGVRTEMDQAVYSPCPLCDDSERPPLWQISASKVIHDEEADEITYKHAFFELFGVPILYTPYFSHPDPTVKRKSGFISPSVGTDTASDSAWRPPITSRWRRITISRWRRFSPPRKAWCSPANIVIGSETAAMISAAASPAAANPESNQADEATRDEFRGHVAGDGQFALGGGWGWGYDLFLASDDTYLERYDFSDLDILENRLFAEKIDGRNYFGANAYGFQGLREDDDQGLIPVVLPLLDVEMSSDPMLFRLALLLGQQLSVTHSSDGLDTRRFSATGGWELPWLGQARRSVSL